MSLTTAPVSGITPDFVSRLAAHADQAERLRRLPESTVAELAASGFTTLLVPRRFAGQQANFPDILDPVRRMAHGCTSTAWTIGFYALHNWMLALFSEQAQEEGFATAPFLAPAPLAPTGRGLPADDGIRLNGRWSWATGAMDANWVIVGALCGPDDAIRPALALLPVSDVTVEDVWHTDGMRATGSNDVIVSDAYVPSHRLLSVVDIYRGTTPGAEMHAGTSYRWPMVPALALVAAMPALGTAEHVADLFADRLQERVLAYEGSKQMHKPMAQARLSEAYVRLRALNALVADTTGQIESILERGDAVPRTVRAEGRLAAAHVVHESRAVIGLLLEASGASAHFLNNPLQRAKRDVDVLSGHVIFDYDVSRELAGALRVGIDIPITAMV